MPGYASNFCIMYLNCGLSSDLAALNVEEAIIGSAFSSIQRIRGKLTLHNVPIRARWSKKAVSRQLVDETIVTRPVVAT